MANYLDTIANIDPTSEIDNPTQANCGTEAYFRFRDYLKSGQTVFFLDTYDYEQVDAFIKKLYCDLKWKDSYGSVLEYVPGVGGFKSSTKEFISQTFGDSGAGNVAKTFYDLLFHRGYDEHSMIVVKGANRLFDSTPECANWVRMIFENNLYRSRMPVLFVFADVGVEVPVDLVPYSVKMKLPPPKVKRIRELIDEELSAWKKKGEWISDKEKAAADRIADYLIGFSETEVRSVLSYSKQYGDGLYVSEVEEKVRSAKKEMVERVGTLKLIRKTTDDFAGLENLREYLKRIGRILKDKKLLQKNNQRPPKGILLVGMPGCGKSLCAKAAQGILDRPLIQLDVGRLLGKYVGESERNMRIALDVAERAAPCILWIDELEKAFSGMDSSDGTALRLFGAFLTWLQENNSDVYVIATANNIDKIPDEFKRRGRFDAIFKTMMPTKDERVAIFKSHLKKVRQLYCANNSDEFDTLCRELATATKYTKDDDDGFSGADINAVVTNAVWEMVASEAKEVTKDMLKQEIVKLAGKTQRDVMANNYVPMREKLKKSGYANASKGKE